MIYDLDDDIDDIDDYTRIVDITEGRLRGAIKRCDGAMETIQASRDGIRPLPIDEYIDWKHIHGNAQADAHKFAYRLYVYGRFYYSDKTLHWMREQDEMEPRKYRLETVWQCWRDVVAARKEYASIPDEVLKDRWGCDPIEIVSRRKIDARVKMEASIGLYDVVCRAFEGRARRDIEQYPIGLRVKQPRRPLPRKRIKKTPTKYVRDANGIKIPLRSK